jgi:hypothetical protein
VVETQEVVILGVVIGGLEEEEMAAIVTDDAKPLGLLNLQPSTSTSFRMFYWTTRLAFRLNTRRKFQLCKTKVPTTYVLRVIALINQYKMNNMAAAGWLLARRFWRKFGVDVALAINAFCVYHKKK